MQAYTGPQRNRCRGTSRNSAPSKTFTLSGPSLMCPYQFPHFFTSYKIVRGKRPAIPQIIPARLGFVKNFTRIFAHFFQILVRFWGGLLSSRKICETKLALH
jgi:hypothetical protein